MEANAIELSPVEMAYRNTPDNAREIGWEYCHGDPSLPYVIHDHKKGTFTYTSGMPEVYTPEQICQF